MMFSAGRGLNGSIMDNLLTGEKMLIRTSSQAVFFQFRVAFLLGIVFLYPLAATSQEKSSAAAEPAGDPSGTWKWEREFRDTQLRSTLKLNMEKGNTLIGTLQTIFGDGGGPGSDPVKIDDGKIDGENITFSVTRNFNGNEFTIEYTGKYSDGKLGGTYTLDFGNGPREFEWQAKRHVAKSDVVGTWSLSFEGLNGQKIESRMTITNEKEKLAGTYHSQFFGDSTMKNIELKDGELSWDVVFETENGDFEVSYSGEPAGVAMLGTITTEFNGQKNETPFAAKLNNKTAAVETGAGPADAAEPSPNGKPTDGAKQLYELRIYTTHDGKLPKLQARFRDHTMKLFEKHGMENVAYWTVSEGARGEEEIKDNLLVYIIAHQDKASREASWKAFMSDPEWKKVAAESQKDGPILSKAPRAILMSATEFSDAIKPNRDTDAAPRLFELRQYNDGPEGVPSTVDRFASGEKDLFTKHGMETVSFWVADDNSAFIYLLAHRDREASRQSWKAFFPEFREFMADYRSRQPQQPGRSRGRRSFEVRFLVPTDYSPYK